MVVTGGSVFGGDTDGILGDGEGEGGGGDGQDGNCNGKLIKWGGYCSRVVTAPDGTMHLMDINGTHYWGLFCGTCIGVKNTLLNKLKHTNTLFFFPGLKVRNRYLKLMAFSKKVIF